MRSTALCGAACRSHSRRAGWGTRCHGVLLRGSAMAVEGHGPGQRHPQRPRPASTILPTAGSPPEELATAPNCPSRLTTDLERHPTRPAAFHSAAIQGRRSSSPAPARRRQARAPPPPHKQLPYHVAGRTEQVPEQVGAHPVHLPAPHQPSTSRVLFPPALKRLSDFSSSRLRRSSF